MDSDMGVLEKSHLPGFVKEKKPDVSSPYSKNYFLSSSWQMGNITLKNGNEIENVLMRFDIVRHTVEFKNDADIYIVSGLSIDSFEWVDSEKGSLVSFDPVKNYYNSETALFGFFEVLDEHKVQFDDYKLLVHHSVWLYPATASVSLSGSHRQNQIHYQEDYYLAVNGELQKFDKKKKNNYSLFAAEEMEVKGFIKKNGLGFKSREDVITIFDYYSELLSSSMK